MGTIAWIMASIGAVALVAIGWWWRRAFRRRCPIDGSIRCRNCQHEEGDGQRT